ncbi:MAG: hypothetical protein SCM96_05450 [Acidobacteriota bacterium]|nr:hypothetical protein [Acidobacteriota bacterium]
MKRKTFGAVDFVKIAAASVFVLAHIWLVFFKAWDTLEINSRPNAVPSPHIMGGTEIGQTFVAPSDGLSRIDVMFGTYGRDNNEDVFFKLWEGRQGQKPVAEIVFNASDVLNNLFTPIAFDPVAGSGGRHYIFILSSPDSTLDNALSVWMNTADVYPGGRAILNGRPLTGDLTFRTYSRKTPAGAWGRILAQVTGLPGSGSAVLLAAAFVLFEAVQIAFLLALVGNLKNRRFRSGFDPEGARA